MFSFVLVSGVLPRAGGPMVRGTEAIMAPKAHGTSPRAVPRTLRWNVDRETASHISSFNRHYAEPSGSAYGSQTTYLATLKAEPTIYYDSVTGDPLFVAPRGRTLQEFLDEGKAHGWPSFRDEEVVWESVRVVCRLGAQTMHQQISPLAATHAFAPPLPQQVARRDRRRRRSVRGGGRYRPTSDPKR